jgi:hypothetical protein
VGETAKKTLVAALLAWLLARVLRRLIAVALLAALLGGGAAVAARGVDVGGVRRVVRCETRAIASVAKQLRDARSSSSQGVGRREPRALGRLGRCQLQRPSGGARHDDRSRR